jgi:hypothetical protein
VPRSSNGSVRPTTETFQEWENVGVNLSTIPGTEARHYRYSDRFATVIIVNNHVHAIQERSYEAVPEAPRQSLREALKQTKDDVARAGKAIAPVVVAAVVIGATAWAVKEIAKGGGGGGVPIQVGGGRNLGDGGLLVFGGPGHQTFLGCFCNKALLDSVYNRVGYGSPVSSDSISNKVSQFGSRFSNYSACNRSASDPPVIVDGNGVFHGRLTIDTSKADRVRDPAIRAWLASVCSQ